MTGPTSDDPPALLDLAVMACRAAGEVMLEIARRGRFGVTANSTADDLVTDADRASERTSLKVLAARSPSRRCREQGGGRARAPPS